MATNHGPAYVHICVGSVFVNIGFFDNLVFRIRKVWVCDHTGPPIHNGFTIVSDNVCSTPVFDDMKHSLFLHLASTSLY